MTTVSMREGQFKLNTFELTTSTGRIIHLGPYCSRADIYENILESTTIAEFIIVDRVGMFGHFNFIDQKINIEYTTYEDNAEASVKYEFYPVEQNPSTVLPDDKGVVFTLVCVSKEAIKSSQIKNAPYVRSKIECEKAILEHLSILETKKQLFFEKTHGLHAFNFTGLNPFVAIDKIRLKAMSSTYKGHCFTFFENSKGYHFKSFEALIKEGKSKIGDKYFVQMPVGEADITASKWRNILACKVVQPGGPTATRAFGAGKVRIKRKNIITGVIEDVDIDSSKLDFVSLNEGSVNLSATTQNELSQNETKLVMTYYDPTVEESDSANAEAVRPYYMAHLLNTIAHITIYGDSTITVGDVITADIPIHDGLTTGEDTAYKESSKTMAGNYLVMSCRHILNFNENAQYLQALEIVKDGVYGELPKARLT